MLVLDKKERDIQAKSGIVGRYDIELRELFSCYS